MKNPQQKDRMKLTLQRWASNPIDFAREVFNFKPSNQQEDFFHRLGELVQAKLKRDLDQPMTVEETELSKKRGISIMAGKGTGKDGAISIAIYWFLFLYKHSNIYAVAPNSQTLRTNLIAEMSKWKDKRVNGKYACKLRDRFDLTTRQCKIKGDPDNGKNWFMTTMAAGPNIPQDKQLETLAGKHARFQMFVIDEASGVPDPVFKPLDETLTDPVNFVILIFNPTRRTGFAIRTQNDPIESKYWIGLHWNAEESSLVTPDQIEYLKDKYGEQSNEYRVAVLGEPPLADDGSLIPYEWCIEATTITFDEPDAPVVFGVDVAREGKDKSIILVRKGHTVIKIYELKENNLFELARYVSTLSVDYSPQAIYVDTAGLGIGVYEKLKELGLPNVVSVNVGTKARKAKRFFRKRDELWWALRQAIQKNTLSLEPVAKDRELISELSSIKFMVHDNGKTKIESKADMKARRMPSPNKADALMLTFFASMKSYQASYDADEEYRRTRKKKPQVSTLSWLTL